MLVVSTVEPLALGGEEVREGLEGEAREEKREVREKREAKEERREDEGLAMESPSKRIRLSSAEEEPGPCDSQDTGAQVILELGVSRVGYFVRMNYQLYF